MEIKFKVVKQDIGDTKAVVYDVTGDKEVVAGGVRESQYNDGRHVRLEPYDVYGNFIGTGSENLDDHIETVKKAYINYLEREKAIAEKYQHHKELADELEVSWELYKKYGNVRNYIGGIAYYTEQLNNWSPQLKELNEFIDNGSFNSVPSAVKKAVLDRIETLNKEVGVAEREIKKQKEWIESYSL